LIARRATPKGRGALAPSNPSARSAVSYMRSMDPLAMFPVATAQNRAHLTRFRRHVHGR